MEGPVGITDLPLQVVSRILSFLKLRDRKAASEVCQKFYQAGCAPEFASATTIGNMRKHQLPDDKTLLRLGLRKIPNVSIELSKNDMAEDWVRIGKRLSFNAKDLSISGKCDAKTVAIVLKSFPRIEVLRLKPKSVEKVDKFFGEGTNGRKELCDSLLQVKELIVSLPSMLEGEAVLELVGCFSGVGSISISSKYIPSEKIDLGFLLPGNQFLELLRSTPSIAQGLQELNLTWVSVSHKVFREIVSITDLKLKSMSFVSFDGEGSNLLQVANADMPLESLEVFCHQKEPYCIRYPSILTLMKTKPSIKHFICQYVMYPAVSGSGFPLADIIKEWPGIDTLNIKGRPTEDSSKETEVYFRVQDGKQHVLQITTPVRFGNDGMLALTKHSPNLQEFAVDPCANALDSTGLGLMASNLGNLRELRLGHNRKSNIHVGTLSSKLDSSRLLNLQLLCLGFCQNITDEDLIGLGFPGLKRLWLQNTFKMTDRGIISIASNNPMLEMLDIGRCKLVTDEGILGIASNLKYLRCLLIPNCKRVTAKSARVLAKKCHYLEYIDITDCDVKFMKAFDRWSKSMVHLLRVLDSHHFGDIICTMKTDYWGFAVKHLLPEATLIHRRMVENCGVA